MGGTSENVKVNDKSVEIFLGRLLRWGVSLAALVVFVGGVWFVAESYDVPQSYREFRGEPAELRAVPQIVDGAIALRPLELIQLGLLLLIATPVARVMFSVLGFALETGLDVRGDYAVGAGAADLHVDEPKRDLGTSLLGERGWPDAGTAFRAPTKIGEKNRGPSVFRIQFQCAGIRRGATTEAERLADG